MARILVIDDEPISRLVIGQLLQDEGYDVAYATDGEQGLTLYRKSPFDLVILDLVMPVKNGLQTLIELIEAYPEAKVIAMSAASPEQLPKAEDFGAIALFVKPVVPEEFLPLVKEVLDARSPRVSSGWDDVC